MQTSFGCPDVPLHLGIQSFYFCYPLPPLLAQLLADAIGIALGALREIVFLGRAA